MKENFISCVLWVPKGVSKSVPDEVKLSPEEMKELIQETRKDIKDIEPDFEDDGDLDGEDEIEDTEEVEEGNETEDMEENDECEDMEEVEDDSDDNMSEEGRNIEVDEEAEEKLKDTNDQTLDSDEEINSKYDMDNYDDSDDGRPCMRINDVTMFVDNKDDQYMEESNSEDEDKKEEEENMQIKNNDNLLVVGHIDGERCSVEVYVYNKEEDDFYVHHEMDMAAFPVALEWMDYHPSEEKPGSYVVVGDMTPVISVWDLDVVGASVPDYSLGIKTSKKKKQKKSNLIGHTEAVISLSWNKKLRNILASGSADKKIILWDLQNCRGERLLEYHAGDVQGLEWDPFEYNYLLSGCTEGLIRIYDYRTGSDEAAYEWSVKGEIERVCWNKSESSKFFCSTDQGFVYSFDINVSAHQHCVQVHKDNITVLDISPDYPNLLMTGGYDQFIKVWDLDGISNQSDKALKPVYSAKTVVGKIYAAKFAPDSELTAAVGGHCPSNNLKILDLGELKPGMKSVEGAISENNMDEELIAKKKKKTVKLPDFQLDEGQESNQNDIYAVSCSFTENGGKSTPHLSFKLTKKKKKNKHQKFQLDEGQQLVENDAHADGSSYTENDMTENGEQNSSHSPSLKPKKKKKKLNENHPYEQQQNDGSAGYSCSNGNADSEPKKKKKKHNQ